MMRAALTIALALLLAACGGGGGASAPARVVAAGDSITLRTGLCSASDTFESCASAGRLPLASAYATHLPADSFQVLAIEGRGGDTCTPQAAYTAGPHAGQARGLALRLGEIAAPAPQAALVLIGVNDVAVYALAPAEVLPCIRGVWSGLRAAGVEPVALTYPPIAHSTQVWALPPGEAASRAGALNREIRAAATADRVRLIDLADVPVATSDGAHPDEPGARAMAAAVVARWGRP